MYKRPRGRRETWATAGQQEVGGEGLERGDGQQDRDHEGERRDQGQRDGAEDVPLAGTIGARGLAQVRGHRLKCCEEQHHAEAEHLEDVDHDQREQRDGGVTQPGHAFETQ